MTMVQRSTRAAVAVTVATALAAAATPSAWGSGVSAQGGNAVGVVVERREATNVAERTRVTARTLRLTVKTRSFSTSVPVEVTLPVGYDRQPRRRWPVVYYLHGANHDETTFRSYGGEAATAGFPAIVVSPRGDAGFWSDWYNSGSGGPPRYETFVVRELIPLVDAEFRTRRDRAHRAVMGESMGGFGTMKLAAKYPDRFVAAASLSGGLDSNFAPGAAVIASAPALQSAAPNSIFGDRLTHEVRWRGNNPKDLARNLRGTDLQLFTGNGVYDPSRGETLVEGTAGCVLEGGIINPTSISMHRELTSLRIPHRWVPLPWGCHGVALFHHEIRQAVVRLAKVFAHPRPRPRRFDYRSIAPSFTAWGWRIRADRSRALEFLTLLRAGHDGVRLVGSGSTTVRTAGYFGPRQRVRVKVADRTARVVRADRSGRISFVVDLGPANRQQAYTPGAETIVRSALVRFRALGGRS